MPSETPALHKLNYRGWEIAQANTMTPVHARPQVGFLVLHMPPPQHHLKMMSKEKFIKARRSSYSPDLCHSLEGFCSTEIQGRERAQRAKEDSLPTLPTPWSEFYLTASIWQGFHYSTTYKGVVGAWACGMFWVWFPSVNQQRLMGMRS